MKHLLIDFENIQPQNLDKISPEQTYIWLFLGAAQKTLPIDLVQSLLKFGERVHIIRLQKMGKNALDFYLSYHLGQITQADSDAMIGIVSKDGGYDVLVEYILLNKKAKNIIRLSDLDDVQLVQSPMKIAETTPCVHTPLPNNSIINQSITPFFQAALTALRQPDAFRPSRVHNLAQNLHKYILRDLLMGQNEVECELTVRNVIKKLQQQTLIKIDE